MILACFFRYLSRIYLVDRVVLAEDKEGIIMNIRSLFAAGLLFSSASVMAVPMTIDFTGAIYTVGSSLTGAGVNVGDTVTGQFFYDTSAADNNPNSGYGMYIADGFNILFGSAFLATSSNTTLTTQNDQQNGSATQPADGLTVRANTVAGDMLNGRNIDAYQFGLRRENASGHLWPDDAIPDASDWASVTLADINAPDWHWMQFDRMASDASIFDSQIRWDVTSFAVTTRVPEPASLLLISIGLAGLGIASRKRKQV